MEITILLRLLQQEHTGSLLKDEERYLLTEHTQSLSARTAKSHGRQDRGPGSFRISWTKEALEALNGHVLVPWVLKVVCTAGIERCFLRLALTGCDLRDGEVVVAVLRSARAEAFVSERDITLIVVVLQTASSFLLRIGRRNFGVVNHRGEGGFVVDAFEAFHPRIGHNDVRVGAPWVRPLSLPLRASGMYPVRR